MKNDDFTDTSKTYSMIMKHVDDRVDPQTEFLTELFDSLTVKNANAVDVGGESTHTLDTFTNTMCHTFFLSKLNAFFLIRWLHLLSKHVTNDLSFHYC